MEGRDGEKTHNGIETDGNPIEPASENPVATGRKPTTGLKQVDTGGSGRGNGVATGRKPTTGLKPKRSPKSPPELSCRDGEKTHNGIETTNGSKVVPINGSGRDGEKTHNGIETVLLDGCTHPVRPVSRRGENPQRD